MKLLQLMLAKAGAKTTAFIVVALAVIALDSFSWIVTCGLIKLITLCFGWTFSWDTATGIWLITCILRSIFSHNATIKK